MTIRPDQEERPRDGVLCAAHLRAGHIPILGEWLALPLAELAGPRGSATKPSKRCFHPVAIRLLEKCDGVLRVGGHRPGPTKWCALAGAGLNIYATLAEIPKPE